MKPWENFTRTNEHQKCQYCFNNGSVTRCFYKQSQLWPHFKPDLLGPWRESIMVGESRVRNVRSEGKRKKSRRNKFGSSPFGRSNNRRVREIADWTMVCCFQELKSTIISQTYSQQSLLLEGVYVWNFALFSSEPIGICNSIHRISATNELEWNRILRTTISDLNLVSKLTNRVIQFPFYVSGNEPMTFTNTRWTCTLGIPWAKVHGWKKGYDSSSILKRFTTI